MRQGRVDSEPGKGACLDVSMYSAIGVHVLQSLQDPQANRGHRDIIKPLHNMGSGWRLGHLHKLHDKSFDC